MKPLRRLLGYMVYLTFAYLSGDKARPPQAQVVEGFVPPTSGTSNYAALDKGIPCVTAEAGRPGACAEEDVRIHVNGVTNVMKTLNLLQGELSPIPTNQRLLDKGQTFIQVTKPGVFTPTLSAGEVFAKGDLVGYVRDIFGETLEELVSPVDGMVWTLLPKMSVDAGDIVYRVLLI